MTSRGLLAAVVVAAVLFVMPAVRAEADPAGVSRAEETADQAAGGAATAGEAADESEDIENRKLPDVFTSEAPNEGTRPPYPEMVKLVASLAAVLALVVGAAWAFKRFLPRTSSMFSSDLVRIVARTYLAPRQMVALVNVPGKLIVVGSTQQSINTLSEITDPVEIERVLGAFEKRSSHSATETFKGLLSTVTGGGRDDSLEKDLTAAVRNVSDRVTLLSSKLESYDRELN